MRRTGQGWRPARSEIGISDPFLTRAPQFAGFSDADKAAKMEIVRKGLGAGAKTCEDFAADGELGSFVRSFVRLCHLYGCFGCCC